MSPLFTIAVTTYNRKEMLKECLASILAQGFPDCEVIVGNNYTEEALTLELLGVSDDRVRIINHENDLGQLGNMNHLLQQARGRYFSWLADDDLLIPKCLESIHSALNQYAYPRCVFCSYSDGAEYTPVADFDVKSSCRLLDGTDFLQQYLSRELKLIGCYGGFETQYLRETGGMKKLGDRFSPYADNLIAIAAGKLDKVAYVDAPLFFFRTHDQSLSYTSADIGAYTSAQEELLPLCESIFRGNRLAPNYRRNMYYLLKWLTGDIYSVAARSSPLFTGGYVNHLRLLEKQARKTGWLYPGFVMFNLKLMMHLVKNRLSKRPGSA